MQIKSSKIEIRKKLLNTRNLLSLHEIESKSEKILETILSLDEIKLFDTILSYFSFKSEVNTLLLNNKILELYNDLYLPACHGDQMDFYQVSNLTDCICGKFGIKEPKKESLSKFNILKPGLIFVPAVSFDITGNRMGYGGGYYDKYLAQCPNLYRIGITYDELLVDSLPYETTDQKVNMIITDKRLIRNL